MARASKYRYLLNEYPETVQKEQLIQEQTAIRAARMPV